MHLFNILLEGALTGLALSLMLGTVFFSLMRNSILYGYQTGFLIASGVIVCDIMFIALALLSHGFAVFLKTYQTGISLTGGLILIGMGIVMIIKAEPKQEEGKLINDDGQNKWAYFFNGFLLNLLNPVNFFSWLAISTMLTISFNYSLSDKVQFFSASLVSIFIVEVLIAYSAFKIKKYITYRLLKMINQVSGCIFLILGVWLAIPEQWKQWIGANLLNQMD